MQYVIAYIVLVFIGSLCVGAIAFVKLIGIFFGLWT